MSDKNVYLWDSFGDNKGMPLGGQSNKYLFVESLFIQGMPIDQAYQKWLTYKGVAKALIGQKPDYEEEVKNTVDWYKNRPPLSFGSSFSKEELETMDTLYLSFSIPFANQKVLNILKQICPNDFEAFPITLHTPTGVSDKYFLINITHRIHNAIDKENSIFTKTKLIEEGEENYITGFKRLQLNKDCLKPFHLGRIHERLDKVLLSKEVSDAIKSTDIDGFIHVVYEDHVNGFYKSNYMPDGKTLRY